MMTVMPVLRTEIKPTESLKNNFFCNAQDFGWENIESLTIGNEAGDSVIHIRLGF